MKTELIAELPPGAFATITLRNGTTFFGEEDSRDELREAGVLRMTYPGASAEGPFEVFCCMHADVLCWSMKCEA